MNKLIYPLFISVLFSGQAALAKEEVKMSAELADSLWTSKKIPEGQQCYKFSGKGQTPRIRVEHIPAGTNALVIEYSDKSYKAMDNGGHGKIGFHIDERMEEVTIPSVKGHSFDLPKAFFMVEAHQAPKWDTAGAYLPPCSGGKGNTYSAKVKAVYVKNEKIDKTLADVDVILGTY